MKKLLSILFLLCAISARADFITATLSVTNTPLGSQSTIASGSDVRIWTNAVSIPATQILIAVGNVNNASNLFYQVSAARFAGQQPPTWDGVSSNVVFSGTAPLVLTVTAGWCKIVYVTNTTTGILGVAVNASGTTAGQTFADTSNQIAMASGVLAGINANATNAFQTNTPAMAKFVDLQNAQSIGNKFITNSTVSNSVVTNAISISGNTLSLTNGNYINGTNFGAQFMTNDLSSLTGWTVLSFGQDIAGNFQNVPFRMFMINGFLYFDTGSTNSLATLQANFIGSGAGLNAIHTTNINGGAWLFANQFTNVGNLYVGSLSNVVTSGTNGLNGAIYSARFNNTALANGANAGVSTGTNVFIKVSGPSSAFTINGMTGGLDDRIVAIENSTGQQIAIANDSGVDPTATNRIYTGTGADLVSTNNPSFFMFKYDASVTHWRLMFASGSPSSGGSGTFSGSFTGNGGGLTNVTSPTFSAYRAGFQAIGNLATSQAVTFATPLASTVGTNYSVSISSDSTLASAVGFSAGSKTTNGFTITLSAGVAGGIGVDYSAIPYQ